MERGLGTRVLQKRREDVFLKQEGFPSPGKPFPSSLPVSPPQALLEPNGRRNCTWRLEKSPVQGPANPGLMRQCAPLTENSPRGRPLASATSKPTPNPSIKNILQRRTLRLGTRHYQEGAESGSSPGFHCTRPNDSCT